MMVAMNPQTWDQDVAEIEPGGYLFYDSTRPLPRAKFRDDINVIGMPLTEICNATYTDPRQRQLFKNIIYVGALSALLDIDPAVIEQLFGEQYKGKEKLLDSNVKALQIGPRLRARPPRRPIGLQVRARRRGRRPHLRRRQQRRGAGLRLRRRHGLRLVPDHAVARRSPRRSSATASKLRVDPETGKHKLRDRAGRGRARLDRHGHRRRLERRARLHRHLGPGHLADDRVHRPGLFRRDPGRRSSTCSAAGRPPACPRARSRPTCSPAPTPRTATPSTCCCSPRTRTSASRCRRTALDLADRLQTPVFVMTDLDIGMNQRLCEPFAWDDGRELRPRQGDDRRGARGRQGLRPLPRRRRRRHPLPHLPGTHPTQGRLLHPRHDARRRTRATPRPGPTTSTTCSGC